MDAQESHGDALGDLDRSQTAIVFPGIEPYYEYMADTRGLPAQADYPTLDRVLSSAETDGDLFNLIVNSPFEHDKVQTNFLFLGIIVLLQVNKKTGTIDRIALSNTDFAKRTTDVSAVPFQDIKIRLDEPENIVALAIRSNKVEDTTDWKFLFEPALTPEQARINQANAGIAYSAVYPLKARDGGALIFSYFQYKDMIGDNQHEFMEKYAKLVDEKLAG